jgi:ketosteroid isomerase-like protein
MEQSEIIQLIIEFNDALNAHDPAAMMRLMSADCVFENTYPPPDGERYVGWEAVRAFWEAFFYPDEGQKIEIEEIFTSGERGVMRWVYRWGAGGQAGHIRGVDVYRVRDGLIVEKLSYVKG